ncbi:MAG: glycoside hydrolase family 2 TIM barrel-domain containing protein [Rikenellaceae bacterium]
MRLLFALSTLLLLSTTLVHSREVYPLNDDWRLFSSSEGSGDRARNISLPFSWSLEQNTPVRNTSTNFLRTLFIPRGWRGERVFLKFGAVATTADLFVNGRHVGEHRGGATAFSFEITDFVDFGESNIVLLRVTSIPGNDILPTSVEYEQYGGIYRDVELIVTPQSAISPVFYGSDGLFVTTRSAEKGSVSGDVAVRFVTPKAVERRVVLSICDKSGTEVFHKELPKVRIEEKTPTVIPFNISNVNLWTPDDPTLYDVTVSLHSVATGALEVASERDELTVTTGFRTISLAKDGSVNGAVRINDKPILFRGVSLYHDHPTLGAELTRESLTQDLDVLQDLGANAIRSAIVPHDRSLYELCDSLGVMVWIDTPLARSPYLSDIPYFPTERFRDNGMQQLREIIYQNYNHPSVMMWGLFSLLTTRGDAVDGYIRLLNEEAQKIDTSRPTVALSNQNGVINNISDLIVWRQNLGWSNGLLTDIGVWRDQLHNKWSSMRSGVLYGEGGSVFHQVDRSEIPTVRTQQRDGWFPEVRQSAMHEEYAAQLSADSLFWGNWMNSLYDFKAPRSLLGENVTGLVSFDRKIRKDSYFLYRALWNKDEPTLHIAGKRARMVGMGDSVIMLRVYASDNSSIPVATVNGREYKMRREAQSQYVIEKMPVRGRAKVVVTQGVLKDSAEFIYDSPLRNPER